MDRNSAWLPERRKRTASRNQLLGTGLFTIVPDEFYVDARAIAGGAPVNGGFGALGPGVTPNFGGFGTQLGALGTTGLSNQNQIQTNSFSIAPYWLHRFGDTGTAKIGYQFSDSGYSQSNSYVPLFFPTGPNAASNISNEGVAQFETGDRFAPFRNLIVADAQLGSGNFQGNSYQYTVTNRLGYVVNHEITVYGEIGYEDDLYYAAHRRIHINDAIWGIGATWKPNPDSQININFGRRYGENNLGFNGSYALTASTRISASYSTGLQTDLQGIQNQLDLASLTSTGETVNGDTGAPLFIGTGGLGVQAGLYRFKAFTASASTVLDRDQFSIWLQISQTTTIAMAPTNVTVPFNIAAPPVGSTQQATSVFVSWTHQISEDLNLSSVASYSTSNVTNNGNQRSVAVSVGLQYLISQTLSATASYSFFDRIASSQVPVNLSNFGQSYYQSLVVDRTNQAILKQQRVREILQLFRHSLSTDARQPVLLRLERPQSGDRAPGLRPGAGGRLHRRHRRGRRRQDDAGRTALVATRPAQLRDGAGRYHAGVR